MNIEYMAPLTRGYQRMKKALFQPFALQKWFAVGFTAFLAGLMDGGGGGNGGGGKSSSSNYDTDYFGELLQAPYTARDWLNDHPQWLALILAGCLLLFVLIVVLYWLSSRGKFMFLDNVVHDRAQIAQPWREFSSLANSLLTWRLFYFLLCFALVVGFLAQVWRGAYDLYFNGSYDVPWLYLIKMGVLFLLLMLVIMYVELLLGEFVVAIMYKHRIPVLEAWSQILTIHWRHLAYFVGFGFCWLGLGIVSLFLVLVGGLMTCCLGFILMIIPYIGSVVLLPFSYTFRSFSLEFLAQFGDYYSVFVEKTPGAIPPAVG